MANTPLPTNLVDEVLDTTMNGKKQYTRIDNPNGTVSFRDDSVYTTVGSKLTAALVNNLCARSNEADNSLYITGDSKNIKFGKDGDGNYGYYKGDGTFTPFSSGEDIGFIAPLFSDTETYYKHDLVIYNDLLYQLTDDTFTGTWDSTKWLEITLTDMEEKESNYIAPPYDSTSTYNTDDVVYYKGVVYKCIEDNITGEFNIFKWQDITLSDLNSNLGGLTIQDTSDYGSIFTKNTTYTVGKGKYYMLQYVTTGEKIKTVTGSGIELVGSMNDSSSGVYGNTLIIKTTADSISFSDKNWKYKEIIVS